MPAKRATHAGGAVSPLEALAERWRADALLLERYGATEAAAACRRHADELEAGLRDEADALLTLDEAERESGYSRDRLRHLVAAGAVPNAGRKGAPLIRRADLPRKRGSRARADFDPDALASQLLGRSA